MLPSVNQLNNHVTLLRKQRFGPNAISLGELTAWHSQAPESSHESFVIDYQTDDIMESHATYRFAITTKALLSHLKVSKNIHTDATYKLN